MIYLLGKNYNCLVGSFYLVDKIQGVGFESKDTLLFLLIYIVKLISKIGS